MTRRGARGSLLLSCTRGPLLLFRVCGLLLFCASAPLPLPRISRRRPQSTTCDIPSFDRGHRISTARGVRLLSTSARGPARAPTPSARRARRPPPLHHQQRRGAAPAASLYFGAAGHGAPLPPLERVTLARRQAAHSPFSLGRAVVSPGDRASVTWPHADAAWWPCANAISTSPPDGPVLTPPGGTAPTPSLVRRLEPPYRLHLLTTRRPASTQHSSPLRLLGSTGRCPPLPRRGAAARRPLSPRRLALGGRDAVAAALRDSPSCGNPTWDPPTV